MNFYFASGESRIFEFGSKIRGLQLRGERPLNCYISAEELEQRNVRMPLAQYLHTIQRSLQVDGRIVIK